MNNASTRVENPRKDRLSRGAPRRRFLALGFSVMASALAGCTEGTAPNGEADGATLTADSNGANTNSGTFRLLISDRPADITDFDSLEVSFDRARIIRNNEGETGYEDTTSTASPTQTVTASEPSSTTTLTTSTETATESSTEAPTPTPSTEAETEGESEEEDSDDQSGFLMLDLGGATVDLTQVVGERAIGISEEEIPEGTYSKIELYAGDVEGIVDGNPVDVMIPSGKLQIVKPFEVEAGTTVSFVFDINVVKKGQSAEYNLLPVIAESGVAGEDVEVEEVENESEDEPTETEAGGTEESANDPGGTDERANSPGEAEREGPPDDDDGSSQG